MSIGKQLISIAILSCGFLTAEASSPDSKWRLSWEENFDGNSIDSLVWGKCTRGNPDWCNTMSDDPSLFQVANGILTLRGIVNPDTSADPSPYLTGGVWTKDKKEFKPGKFEIKARLHGAKGAWPAIWLLPYDYKK